MYIFRSLIAFLLIALSGSHAWAEGDEAADPAPSGNEQTHITVGETGAVAGPGRDYDNGTGSAPSTSHDFSGWDRSSEDDTSVDYSSPSDSNSGSDEE